MEGVEMTAKTALLASLKEHFAALSASLRRGGNEQNGGSCPRLTLVVAFAAGLLLALCLCLAVSSAVMSRALGARRDDAGGVGVRALGHGCARPAPG